MANEVKIIISADGTAAIAGVRSVSDSFKTIESDTNGVVGNLKKYWLDLGVAITGAISLYKGFDLALDSAKLAARVETLGIVMQTVGKNAAYSKAEVQAYSEGVRKMGITTQEANQTVIRMMQAHLDLTKSQELARVAQDAAVIGNINSSEALMRLMWGITTLQPELLRTVGITVEFESAYKRFASSVGRTTESLSSQEKQQIALNLVLERGKDITGSYEAAMGTTGKLMTSLPRFIEEVKLKFGELFTPALGIIIEGMIDKLKSWERTLAEMKASGDLEHWADNIKTGFAVAVGSIENLWSAAKKCISIAYDLKDALIAASMALGSYYIIQAVTATVQTGKLITQMKELVTVVEILAYRSLTALLTPAGMVAAALGALAFVVMEHYREQREAAAEMERFKTSLATFSADANTQAMINQLEITALEIEAVGGASDAARQKIEMLKQVMSGGAQGSQKEWWKDVVHYMDIGGGKSLPPPQTDAAKKGIEDINRKLREEIAKTNQDVMGLLYLEAAEYKKKGADEILLKQWIASKKQKIEQEALEKTLDALDKAAQHEISLSESIAKTKRDYELSSLEASSQQKIKILQMQVNQGYLPEIEFIRKRNLLEEESLLKKQANINALMIMEQNEAKATELWFQYLEVEQKIKNLKEYEVFEIDAVRLSNQQKLNDLIKDQLSYQKKGYDDTWTKLMDMANQVGGEAGQGLGKMGASLKGIADTKMGKDPASQRYQEALKHYNDLKALAEQSYVDDYTMLQTYNQMKLTEDQMYSQQKAALVSGGFGMMAGAAQAFYALSGNQSKEAFVAFQALAIAQTLINTYQAAVGAYAAMSSIMYVGPALGIVAAAAAMAFGMAQVASIASMKPGGGTSSASVPASSGGYSYNTPTTNTWESQTETKQAERPMVINVHIAGHVVDHDAFAREMVPSIQKAVEDGMRL